ncbi:response regulator transcription factor [Nakamurella flava]|uniref:Response regulator transcription factor n=1 Tax=Nakamurella flava TaxID=2576308 RepID=A0A4U6QK58_9ACTN|nr:LuxR C-terminal-related transcriptional regulator [Nakamurella flava]TKV60478.1 response regulator transcription factor [Nakamurella flava]
MRVQDDAALLFAEPAAETGTTSERGTALLEVVRREIPFDGAFLAIADPPTHGYFSVTGLDLDSSTVEFLSTSQFARDLEVTGADHDVPPVSPSDLPFPAADLPTWADHLIPAGIHEGLGIGLFAADGRHVGHLAVLFGSRQRPSTMNRRRLERLAPALAQAVDPLRPLLAAAGLVRDAVAGAVLLVDGGRQSLPGLPTGGLLAPSSLLLAAADRRIREGAVCSAFLSPTGCSGPSADHVRVTVLRAPRDGPPSLTGIVLLSPAPDRHGLSPRELEVLGLLIEGWSNQQIAQRLVVTPRTVATHLEHILAKLGASCRTLAAVRAERDGLYVPPAAKPDRQPPNRQGSTGIRVVS